jgi:glutamate dehydrogenase
MNASTQAVHNRLAAVLALAAARLDASRQQVIRKIAPEYFQRLDPHDLAERTPEDLLGALLSHLELGEQRQPGQPTIRVFSPTPGEDGWSSPHSVIHVINDDMPFLVDSTTLEINREGYTLQLIVHPIYAVRRDAAGKLVSIAPREDDPQAPRESWMYVEIDRIVDAAQRDALAANLRRVLGDVRAGVQDWKRMLARVHEAVGGLEHAPDSVDPASVAESQGFLQWLADDHFTFLGYRQHDLVQRSGEPGLQLVPGSGLGLLRETPEDREGGGFTALPQAARVVATAPEPLVLVTKANNRSTVHRAGYCDLVSIKRYSPGGEVIGEHRFVGLFTSIAYSARVGEIPLLRGKVQAIAQRAGLPRGGHLDKALHHILETFPRDDLFQIPTDDLYETAIGVLSLGERQRLRLFVWRDPFERFISCLVYVPREAFSTDLRIRFQRILLGAFNGTSIDFDVLLSDAVLARIHFTVRTAPGTVPVFDTPDIERQLAAAARRWDDELRERLVDAAGEASGLTLFKRWASAFPPEYRDRVAAADAVPDVHKLATLSARAPLALALYPLAGAGAGALGLKVYRRGAPLVLSDSLPMLEHMGARVISEASYRIDAQRGSDAVTLHDFALQAPLTGEFEVAELAPLFEATFARVLEGSVESDEFNRLVLLAALAADDVVILRAYAKYLKQIGFAQSQATIAGTLAAHPRIARMLVKLFKLRFDPAERESQAADAQVHAIEQALEKVSNLSEDRVLRQMLALLDASLRTNFWRTGVGASGEAGPRRSFLSIKLDSAKVPGLPQPRPLYEIWVYSPRFEGIHLRGGKVARGGLRWSDRADDFRTEILGLMKAQMVKNAVIVPVGSKGGFVLKKAPPASDRDAFMREGVACYQDYLRGLLDVTDNLVDGKPVPPPQVVRIDGDDPYLVVAADKGTASFSDYANGISEEYGFWLGDAFASGGSVGYDHKDMGITARGAWESVKRHFRELGVDVQRTDFTVVGIGDMSGDVFGNGMLLSPHTKLVAAFDHRHVFIDPQPDTVKSMAERRRLFQLPRSSWADYDTALISEGGGVWARSEKSIPLSPQARAVLGVQAERLPPGELISAILRAPVDLLYNGGIGTYVKASSESNADVGDRANDALRINGRELRCKVVGEGGNLGFTQRGRIEAALAGVRLYTDAIDNSAGVDTSDHEVNIKILLGIPVADGRLTREQRNELLPTMTDEIAALVLRDNYFQTQALSVGRSLAVATLDEHARFIRFLEKIGRLDRAIEFLPDEEEIAQRRAKGTGLTAPELAVLLAYSKMWLFDAMVDSALPEDAWIATALFRYFPAALRERFGDAIPRHPLHREIVATHVVNSMVNRVGPTFVHQLLELTGAAAPQVVKAYLLAREVFGSVELWQAIETLDNKVADAVQREMIVAWRGLVHRATAWFLRSRHLDEPAATAAQRLAPAIAVLRQHIEPQVTQAPQVVAWVDAGVPPALALQVGAAGRLFSALDIAEIAEQAGGRLEVASAVYFAVGERLGLERLRQQIVALRVENHWQHLAKVALDDDLADLQRAIALDVVGASEGDAAARLADWEHRKSAVIGRATRLLAEIADGTPADLAIVSVALRELRQLG